MSERYHNSLVYVLLASALITMILGMWTDASVILLVVILNTVIGFIQEGKAEASIEALQKMMAPDCTVLRDGQEQKIPARDLVPGDIVLLEGGDRVPADLRLFGTKNLRIDEAVLTGESVPVSKETAPVSRPNLPPGEQTHHHQPEDRDRHRGDSAEHQTHLQRENGLTSCWSARGLLVVSVLTEDTHPVVDLVR